MYNTCVHLMVEGNTVTLYESMYVMFVLVRGVILQR